MPPVEATTETMDAARYQALGIAAEQLLTARLLELGHKVAVPVTDDDGVDLIVNYRTLVQVKSCASRAKDGSLRVALHTMRAKERRGGSRSGMFIREHIDIIAIHARDSGAWWFMPRSAMPLGGAIHVTEYGPRSAWKEAWHLFEPLAIPDDPIGGGGRNSGNGDLPRAAQSRTSFDFSDWVA